MCVDAIIGWMAHRSGPSSRVVLSRHRRSGQQSRGGLARTLSAKGNVARVVSGETSLCILLNNFYDLYPVL